MMTPCPQSGRGMNAMSDGLLATDEPPPFTACNENGTSPLLVVADHAAKHFPRRRRPFQGKMRGYMACDVGADAACCLIGKALDAVWST
jgi:predicted N-formylglutamate amidohydrolase